MSSFEKLVSLYNGPSSNLAVGTSSGPDEGNNSTDEAAADTTPRPDAFPRGRLRKIVLSPHSPFTCILQAIPRRYSRLFVTSVSMPNLRIARRWRRRNRRFIVAFALTPAAAFDDWDSIRLATDRRAALVAKNSTERERLLQRHLGRLWPFNGFLRASHNRSHRRLQLQSSKSLEYQRPYGPWMRFSSPFPRDSFSTFTKSVNSRRQTDRIARVGS